MSAMSDLVTECGYEEMGSLERPFKPQAIYPVNLPLANQNPLAGKPAQIEKVPAPKSAPQQPAAVPLQDNESKPHAQEEEEKEVKVEDRNEEAKANEIKEE